MASRIIDELNLCASIAQLRGKPVKYFVTSSKYGALIDEMAMLMSPLDRWRLYEKARPVRVNDFFEVINSGSEDEDACHHANKAMAYALDFQNVRKRLITGTVGISKPAPEDTFAIKPEIVD